MPKRLVFFVPGIMGSVLRFVGPGPFGNQVDEEVWGSDPGVILDTLARRPQRLGSPNLQPTEVLRRIRGKVWGKTVDEVFYGPLLDFCVEKEDKGGLALDPETEFVPFAYDWRKDNRDSANALATRIAKVDPEGNRRIGLVAHSMGGLICRLLLLTEQSIASRIAFFLQIASPTLGSAKAFHTLREGPAFSRKIDFVVGVKHHGDLQLKSDLMAVLRTFPSMYQLLPPEGVPVLLTPTGKMLPAVAQEAWLRDYHVHLSAARAVHAMLTNPLPVPVKCVYANDHRTTWCYKVDDEFRIKGWWEEPSGDGTVLCASAFEGTELGNRLRIAKGETTHDELPRHAEVRESLRALVAQMS